MAIAIRYSSNLTYCNEPWKETQGSIRDSSCWILDRSRPLSWYNSVSEAEGLQGDRADTGIGTQMWIGTHGTIFRDIEIMHSVSFSLVFCCQQVNMPGNLIQCSFCVEKVPLLSHAKVIPRGITLHLTCSCSGKQYCGPLDSVIYSYFLAINFPGAWTRLALGGVTFLCSEQA